MHSVWKTLAGRHGEVVSVLDDALPDGRRRLQFDVELPGYGVECEATLVFLEEWDEHRDGWRLAEYELDYHRHPPGIGRKAHHLHRLRGLAATRHAHCEDPEAEHAHYRDVEITLLEAAEEFTRIHATADLRCEDLLPLYL